MLKPEGASNPNPNPEKQEVPAAAGLSAQQEAELYAALQAYYLAKKRAEVRMKTIAKISEYTRQFKMDCTGMQPAAILTALALRLQQEVRRLKQEEAWRSPGREEADAVFYTILASGLLDER